jgi:RHS repeat-associated protein
VQASQIGSVSSYRYNGLGQRISKIAGTTVTHYTYGLNGQLLSETTGADTTDYLYFNGQPLALVRQGGMYYIHTDHLGTPRAVTNTYQQVVWRWDSDPFGMMAANEDPDGDGTAFVFNLRFAGQYYDKETGLHYNYFRYYDPRIGRYITSDPIGLRGGLNTYGYVNGNPLLFIDKFGLDDVLRLKYRLTKGEFKNITPDHLPIKSEYYVFVDEKCKTRVKKNTINNNIFNSIKPKLKINHADLFQVDKRNKYRPAVEPAIGWSYVTEEHYEYYSDQNNSNCDCSEKFGGGKYDNGLFGYDEFGAWFAGLIYKNYKSDYSFIVKK